MSEGNGDGKPAAADGGQQAAPQTNFDRLLSHLAKGSIAAKLVTAYAGPGAATPADAVAKVATDRLDELKHSYDKPEDKKN